VSYVYSAHFCICIEVWRSKVVWGTYVIAVGIAFAYIGHIGYLQLDFVFIIYVRSILVFKVVTFYSRVREPAFLSSFPIADAVACPASRSTVQIVDQQDRGLSKQMERGKVSK
jgi:hypothetical protein